MIQPTNQKQNEQQKKKKTQKSVRTNERKICKKTNKHFPTSNKQLKMFNWNTIKLTHCCTENVQQIIKNAQ